MGSAIVTCAISDEATLLARQLISVYMIQHEYSDARDDLDDDMTYIWAKAGFDEVQCLLLTLEIRNVGLYGSDHVRRLLQQAACHPPPNVFVFISSRLAYPQPTTLTPCRAICRRR